MDELNVSVFANCSCKIEKKVGSYAKIDKKI